MQISKISTQHSFGELYVNVKPNELEAEAIASQLAEIKDVFKQNKFDKKRWVDVILNYNKEEGFYGVISSKEQGTPINHNYKHPISTNKKVISSFRKWLNDWNQAYSPSTLRKIESMQEDALRFARSYYSRENNSNSNNKIKNNYM